MAFWTWLTWPDPLVDFGRELYVPWQITHGKVLYRDIAYFNGPLSPYFNAMIFSLLGTSLRSIVLVNLILLAILVRIISSLWAQVADRFVATVSCIVLLTVFSFIQLIDTGNYNFVTPYSHEITHGVILSMAMIACFSAYLKNRGNFALVSTGFVLGLIFLTKPEVFVAALAAIATGLLLGRPGARPLCGFALASLAAPLAALLLLSRAMPLADACRGVLGGWVYLLDSRVTGLIFYRKILGIDDPAGSAKAIMIAAGVYGGILTLAIASARLLPRRPATVAGILVVLSVCAAIVFNTLDPNIWKQSFRGLTVVLPLIAGLTVLHAVKQGRNANGILRATIAIFAMVLLAKIFFNVQSFHYGFALAMPAALVVIAAAMSWLPQGLGGNGRIWNLRAAVLPAIGLVIFVHLYVFGRFYANKPLVVSQSADSFRADSRNDRRGRAVNMMLRILGDVPLDATLATVPEGAMVNYLSSRANPTPYISLMPPEVLMFGEDRILRAYKEHPPAYLIFVKYSDVSEYGYQGFGVDYGQEIWKWMTDSYVVVPTRAGPDFPLVLYRRR